ncbi:MAG: hypothetical protein EBU93_07760, partial [Chlamydiae bacterium]|nr:hypothetical protein [Chlamydiota bacterium]
LPTMKKILQINGLALRNATKAVQDNTELVCIAVTQNPMALEHASSGIRDWDEMGRWAPAASKQFLSNRVQGLLSLENFISENESLIKFKDSEIVSPDQGSEFRDSFSADPLFEDLILTNTHIATKL